MSLPHGLAGLLHQDLRSMGIVLRAPTDLVQKRGEPTTQGRGRPAVTQWTTVLAAQTS